VRERSHPPLLSRSLEPLSVARLTDAYATSAAAAAEEVMEREGKAAHMHVEGAVAAAQQVEALRLSRHLWEHSAADDLRAAQLDLVVDPSGEFAPRRAAGSPLDGQ
jgi:hypothetical protein